MPPIIAIARIDANRTRHSGLVADRLRRYEGHPGREPERSRHRGGQKKDRIAPMATHETRHQPPGRERERGPTDEIRAAARMHARP